MRILQVITSLRTGGAERMVTELSKRMVRSGEAVEVLLFDGTRTPMCEELESAGVKVHALGRGEAAMHNPLLLFKLRRFLRKNKYDIVHTHNTPCQLLVAFASHRKTRLITTEHNTSNRRRNHPVLRPFDRWMYSRYQKIVCVSEETRNELSQWLRSKRLDGRMSVIPNGIDLDRFANASPAEDVMEDKRFKVIMVSAFRPEKDQMTLIRAMARLSEDCVLLLAGGAELPAHRTLMESCRQAAAELGIADRVRFLGIRNDIPALLAASDVAVMSSHYDGFCLFAVEAMASGKPLIVSDVAGMRDVVAGAGLLFSCSDDERLAKIISQLREDKDLREGIARSCLERAERYDIGRTVEGYRDLYKKITI